MTDSLNQYTVEDIQGFMQTEEFEQLDELSKKTLTNYVLGATSNLAKTSAEQGDAAADADNLHNTKFYRKFLAQKAAGLKNKAEKRSTGINKALDRLSENDVEYTLEDLQNFMQTEEFEQLDELSKKTLGSYIKKATKNVEKKEADNRRLDDKEKSLSDRIGMAREKRAMLAQRGNGSGRIQSSAETKLYGQKNRIYQDVAKNKADIKNRKNGMERASKRLTKEEYQANTLLLLKAIHENDATTVANIFNDLMSESIAQLAEEYKQEVSDSIFNESELNELTGATLGSYIQKAVKDSRQRKKHSVELDSDPKVEKLSTKIMDYHNRREYDKYGNNKYQNSIDLARSKIQQRKKEIDPNYPKSVSTRNRSKGIKSAIQRLQYGDTTDN